MPARMILAVLVALLMPIPAIAQDINSQLIEAAKNGDTVSIQALLEAGADVNAKDEDLQTALMWAANEGHTRIVSVLLNAGADVNAKDDYSYTALSEAVEGGHADIVRTRHPVVIFGAPLR